MAHGAVYWNYGRACAHIYMSTHTLQLRKVQDCTTSILRSCLGQGLPCGTAAHRLLPMTLPLIRAYLHIKATPRGVLA